MTSQSPYRTKATYVSPQDLIKRVDTYFDTVITYKALQVEEITEKALESGERYTAAILREGGRIDPLTNKFVDPIYFLVVSIGPVDAVKGNLVNVYASPLGVTTVETLYLGEKPMIVMVGDIQQSYDDREFVEVTEDMLPELKEEKERKRQRTLNLLSAYLEGSKIELTNSSGENVEVRGIDIDGYFYAPPSPIPVPYGGVTIPLEYLVNSKGQSFRPVHDQDYSIVLTTNLGETTKYSIYNKDGVPRADRVLLSEIAANFQGRFQDETLQMTYSGEPDIEISSITIDGSFTYIPEQSIFVTSANPTLTIGIPNFKDSGGTAFVKEPSWGGWSMVHIVTIISNYGEFSFEAH